MFAGERTLLRHASCAVKLNGQWHASTQTPQPAEDVFALRWQAGEARVTARLTSHEGGLVIECELTNLGPEPIIFNGWRPLQIDPSGGGALYVGDEPWRATVLVNGYQSWDYAGIHPLDEAVKDTEHASITYSAWTAAIYGRDRDAMFVAQTLKASRFATVFSWYYHRDQKSKGTLPTAITTFHADQQGAPLSQPEQRSGMPEDLALEVPAGDGLVSDPILLLYGEDGTATLSRALQLAGRASGSRSWPAAPRGWCSWYQLGLAVTDADVRRNAAALNTRIPQLAKTLRDSHRPVIQLDDGWMPRWQRWGDWVTNEYFSQGLRSLASALRKRRLEAGIWLAPFHAAADSELARTHPDWLLQDAAGKRLTDPRLDRPYHVLDSTRPQVLEFLGSLFGGLRKEGFTYFKIDFLYAAAYESRRYDPQVTGVQALRSGLRRIFEAVNPPGKPETAFVLASGAPLMPLAGLVHGSRIGGDVASPQMTDGVAGTPMIGFGLVLSMARNQAARVFLNQNLFLVDPDVVMASPQLTEDEARVMITVGALSGGVFMYSDDLETLPPDRLNLLRNPNVLELVGGPAAEPVHLFSAPELEARDHWYAFPQELPPLWVRRDKDGSFIAAVYNWSDQPRPYRVLFSEVAGHEGPFVVTDLWSSRRGGRALGVKAQGMRLQLPPHSVRLLRMKDASAADAH